MFAWALQPGGGQYGAYGDEGDDAAGDGGAGISDVADDVAGAHRPAPEPCEAAAAL